MQASATAKNHRQTWERNPHQNPNNPQLLDPPHFLEDPLLTEAYGSSSWMDSLEAVVAAAMYAVQLVAAAAETLPKEIPASHARADFPTPQDQITSFSNRGLYDD